MNWQNCPMDILSNIHSRLSPIDKLRFGSTCCWWNRVSNPYNNLPPLLLFRPYDPVVMQDDSVVMQDPERGEIELQEALDAQPEPQENQVRFYCPALSSQENLVFEAVARVLDGRTSIVGSSHGYLFLLDKLSVELSIFEPFSGREINLPRKATLPCKKVSAFICEEGFRYKLIHKAILTRDVSRGRASVVIIYGANSNLAISGVNRWLALSLHEEYVDVSCMRDMVYALRIGYLEVFLDVWDVSGPEAEFWGTKTSPRSTIFKTSTPLPRESYHLYLVPAEEGLYVVLRMLHSPGVTQDFHVFKFSHALEGARRNRLKRVSSLNNRAFFVGRNHSLAYEIEEVDHFFQNSIYFTDDSWDNADHDPHSESDSGVFLLQNVSLYKYDDTEGNIIVPTWLFPGLLREVLNKTQRWTYFLK